MQSLGNLCYTQAGRTQQVTGLHHQHLVDHVTDSSARHPFDDTREIVARDAELVGKNVRYRGSLQNYLIDTDTEVILVDTGLPAGTPEETSDENAVAFTGHDISTYMEAFAASAPRTSSTRHSQT